MKIEQKKPKFHTVTFSDPEFDLLSRTLEIGLSSLKFYNKNLGYLDIDFNRIAAQYAAKLGRINYNQYLYDFAFKTKLNDALRNSGIDAPLKAERTLTSTDVCYLKAMIDKVQKALSESAKLPPVVDIRHYEVSNNHGYSVRY